jgi:DNA-binding winged helix-turn-helix (wHTH) protein
MVGLRISGRIDGEHVDTLRELIAQKKAGLAIDLTEVLLADRKAVRLLAASEANGIELRNCPAYIREWAVRTRRKNLVTDMDYKQILAAKETELQSVAGMLEIQGAGASDSRAILQAGDLRLDLDRHLLWKANGEIHLSPKEFALLSYLFKNPGALITHGKLLRAVWGPECGNDFEYLRTYIHALRRKIEDDPATPQYILTEPWIGYKFRNPSDRRAQDRSESMNNLNWLLSCIVHDFRNPVATIYAGTELLMNVDPTSAQVKRLAANMYRAAGCMRDLLADVTYTAFGNVSTTESCEIRELIAAAWDAASAATESSSVRILIDVPRDIELPLVPYRMKRVFFNLITNALEAMPGGGEVRVGARKTDHYVLIEIEDTGPGIPHDIRDRVFEPFVTTGKANGLGLGLALSRRAVLDAGGDMWIEAAAGTRFVIRFPLTERHPGYKERVGPR